MTYNFFLLSKDDALDGTKIGYAYAKLNEDKWISVDGSSLAAFLTIGFVKGCDYIVHEDKAYGIMKSYTDIDNSATLIIAVESTVGCDNKKVFNKLDNSSKIVIKNKTEEPANEGSNENAGD